MATSQASQDNPLAGFGPNEWIVEEMYQRYLADPASVDSAWHEFFADYRPNDGTRPRRARYHHYSPFLDSTPAPAGGGGRRRSPDPAGKAAPAKPSPRRDRSAVARPPPRPPPRPSRR